MILDETKYVLSDKNYVKKESDKTLIVIGNTFNNNMKHFLGWQNRYNGKYNKTAAFTIDAAGFIYKHFEPKYKSNFFDCDKLNDKTIVILLENYGWLYKDIEKNQYITWLGDIYNKSTEVIEKRWRNYRYWDPYTIEQQNSSLWLVSKLSENFNIPKTVISHNTKLDDFLNYKGVLYRSNLDKNYTDLNPSWDFEIFKEKLENI